ncbi:histidine kinase (plasmid) [Fulvitalea axinellae]|uniref:Histidine kinase n=1 Tax=Fulvitalea axinellae TaxID=1182444 RepID=A0AAU9DIL0_9BACT|nr:histidine kinase [Fulvitalea axinellae]
MAINFKNDKLKPLKYLPLHLLAWSAVLWFYIHFFGFQSNDSEYAFFFSACLMPVSIGTTYTTIYYLIPKYLLQKRYWKFAIYSLYTLIISAYFIIISIFYAMVFLSELRINDMPPMSKSVFIIFVGIYLVVLAASAVYLFRHAFKAQQRNHELEKKILATQLLLKEQEIEYLKMQIRPHFLFNTLNSLYGFALTKSEDTPELILKLSNLLDYLLYQTKKPLVSLAREAEHLNDYLQLEKARFKDSLDIRFQTDGELDDVQIAPMLLIPFVENAFKHGRSNEGTLSVSVNLSVNEQTIDFKVHNTTGKPEKVKKKHGIGLSNMRKRLEMLYPDRHSLELENDEGWFEARLSVTIGQNLETEIKTPKAENHGA